MNYPLQQQIEALLPEERKLEYTEDLNCTTSEVDESFNEALSLCKQSLPKIIELTKRDTIEQAIEVVLNNSTPSNDQMNIVRALRKLLI